VKRLGTANDFIVHAATFLRQARWRDYLTTAETLIGATSGAGGGIVGKNSCAAGPR
jgi:hypothetical protein